MNDYLELRRLAEEATNGPWMYWGETGHEIFSDKGPGIMSKAFMLGRDTKVEDAVFVAAANPSVILELLDLIDELHGELLQRGEHD